MNLLEFYLVFGVVWCPVSRSHPMHYGCHGNSWASTYFFGFQAQDLVLHRLNKQHVDKKSGKILAYRVDMSEIDTIYSKEHDGPKLPMISQKI